MSENRDIVRAAGVVGVLTLGSRIAGLLRDVVIGYAFGTGVAADAFFVAFRIPNLLRRFVAEGAMSAAFVPVFSESLAQRGWPDTVLAVRAVGTMLAVILTLLTAFGVLLAPLWVGIFAPGFAADPDKLRLTAHLTATLFPYVFLVSMTALFGGLLNVLRHFTAPALSPVLLNLSMVAAALLVAPRLATPIYALAWGVLVGGVLQVTLQLVPLLRRGFSFEPLWAPRHPAVRRVVRLMAPTLFGAAIYQINLLMSTVLASALPAGSVSYLWYADRVFEFPLGIFAVALGTAALPSFATQAARGAYGEMRHSLSFAMRLNSFIAVPATVGLILLARPIVAVLFQRGAFGAAEVGRTAAALIAFSLALWPVSVARTLVPAFYATGDTRTPVLAGAATFAASILFSLMFMGPVTAGDGSRLLTAIAWATGHLGIVDLRHAGLALATSLAAVVNMVLLAAVLARRLGGLEGRAVAASLGRSLLATVAMGAAVSAVGHLGGWGAGALADAGVLAATIAVGGAAFAVSAWFLGGPEIAALRRGLSSLTGRVPTG